MTKFMLAVNRSDSLSSNTSLPCEQIVSKHTDSTINANRKLRHTNTTAARFNAAQARAARLAQLSLIAKAPELADDFLMLSVTLQMVSTAATARRLATHLLQAYGSMACAVSASEAELRRRTGLTITQVAALKAIRGTALRLIASELNGKPIMKAWDTLIDYLLAALGNEPVECLRVLFLDSRNRLVADVVHARGTLNHTPFYPREIMKAALDLHASAVVLAHNHPSGDPTPSAVDISLTRETAQLSRGLGINLYDHIIIGAGAWYSFRLKGILTEIA